MDKFVYHNLKLISILVGVTNFREDKLFVAPNAVPKWLIYFIYPPHPIQPERVAWSIKSTVGPYVTSSVVVYYWLIIMVGTKYLQYTCMNMVRYYHKGEQPPVWLRYIIKTLHYFQVIFFTSCYLIQSQLYHNSKPDMVGFGHHGVQKSPFSYSQVCNMWLMYLEVGWRWPLQTLDVALYVVDLLEHYPI